MILCELQIDVLEAAVISNVILLQTVLQEVRELPWLCCVLWQAECAFSQMLPVRM